MKRIKYWFLAMLLAPIGAQAATVNVWVDPSDSGTYTIGETFTVNIMGSWDTNFASGAVTLAFDPSVVQVTGGEITVATFGGWSTDVTVDNASGEVSPVGFINFLGGHDAGTYQIASVDMVTVGHGTSALSLYNPEHYAFPWYAGTENGMPIPVTFNSTPGTVSAVPLPAAAWFMLSGLGFLAFRSRRSA